MIHCILHTSVKTITYRHTYRTWAGDGIETPLHQCFEFVYDLAFGTILVSLLTVHRVSSSDEDDESPAVLGKSRRWAPATKRASLLLKDAPIPPAHDQPVGSCLLSVSCDSPSPLAGSIPGMFKFQPINQIETLSMPMPLQTIGYIPSPTD